MEVGTFVFLSILNSENSALNAQPQVKQYIHELPTAGVVFTVKVDRRQSLKPWCDFLIHTCVVPPPHPSYLKGSKTQMPEKNEKQVAVRYRYLLQHVLHTMGSIPLQQILILVSKPTINISNFGGYIFEA